MCTYVYVFVLRARARARACVVCVWAGGGGTVLALESRARSACEPAHSGNISYTLHCDNHVCAGTHTHSPVNFIHRSACHQSRLGVHSHVSVQMSLPSRCVVATSNSTSERTLSRMRAHVRSQMAGLAGLVGTARILARVRAVACVGALVAADMPLAGCCVRTARPGALVRALAAVDALVLQEVSPLCSSIATACVRAPERAQLARMRSRGANAALGCAPFLVDNAPSRLQRQAGRSHLGRCDHRNRLCSRAGGREFPLAPGRRQHPPSFEVVLIFEVVIIALAGRGGRQGT